MGLQEQASHYIINKLPVFSLTRMLSSCLVFIALTVYTPVLSAETSPVEDENAEIRITHKILNGNAILSCIVPDLGRRRIIWARLSDPYPIAVGTTIFHPAKNKYKVSNEVATNILTINKVGLQDAGEYQCLASGGFQLKAVISLNIQAGRDSTYFLHSNRSVISAVGLDVKLPCMVENLKDKRVLWKDGRNNVLSLRKRIYNGNDRLKVLHSTRPQWDLQIKKLQEKDFGFYTCVVNSDPVLTRTIELINDEPPKIAPLIKKDTHFRKKITVTEGETVTMTCNFHAYPPATIKWYIRYKEGEKLKKRYLNAMGNDYTLQSVTLAQAGDYVCIGRNGVKPEGRARTKLIVQAIPTTVPTTVATTVLVPSGPASPRVYHEQLRVGQRRGRNAELKCFVVGSPRPNVHWVRQGHRILDDHKYKAKNRIEGRFTTHSTLLIRSVSTRDYGTYKCVGTNQYGLKELDFHLYKTDN